MNAHAAAASEGWIDPSEIRQIELYIVRRMREIAPGEHSSLSSGAGTNLVGLRDWQAGDPITSVDWAQSSLSNFSPLVTRQFEEDRNATVLALVDASQSTRCGMRDKRIAATIARSLAVIGFSAAFFQDSFGFVSFGDGFESLTAEPTRTGRGHVMHCLALYQRGTTSGHAVESGNAAATASGYLARTALIPVISDFLLADVGTVIDELARLNSVHDVLLVMIDARFAFDLPPTSAGWMEVYDVESGSLHTLSRKDVMELTQRVEEWQRSVERLARAHGLDVVTLGLDPWQSQNALAALVAERRVRRVRA
jgi:uncharacterized protein (DUF58 family)